MYTRQKMVVIIPFIAHTHTHTHTHTLMCTDYSLRPETGAVTITNHVMCQFGISYLFDSKLSQEMNERSAKYWKNYFKMCQYKQSNIKRLT